MDWPAGWYNSNRVRWSLVAVRGRRWDSWLLSATAECHGVLLHVPNQSSAHKQAHFRSWQHFGEREMGSPQPDNTSMDVGSSAPLMSKWNLSASVSPPNSSFLQNLSPIEVLGASPNSLGYYGTRPFVTLRNVSVPLDQLWHREGRWTMTTLTALTASPGWLACLAWLTARLGVHSRL